MKKEKISLLGICMPAVIFLFSCTGNNPPAEQKDTALTSGTGDAAATGALAFGGFESQVKWGEHLVTICGCHDCHTPKKMGPQGMEPDFAKALCGHPAELPQLAIDRKDIEKKGLIISNDLTQWAGPWGVSYAANLTPDDTGIGNWKEEQFIFSLRNGIAKGLPGSRTILPPMPWQMFKNMSDDEMKAIFAYLKTIPPIKNQVPSPLPPANAPAKS